MKDAKGHGSDSRGSGGALAQAADNFVAAHQAGVNQAAPSQTGRDLYVAAMGEAKRAEQGNHFTSYDEKTMRDMEPDFDEMPSNDPVSGTGRYAR